MNYKQTSLWKTDFEKDTVDNTQRDNLKQHFEEVRTNAFILLNLK